MVAWAALGKVVMGGLKAGTKKVATDKLLNRKKKRSKKRRASGKDVSDDIMNKKEGEEKKGGELAVRPSMGLVPVSRDLSPISTTPGESDIVIIKKQVIQVRDILKDSRSAKESQRIRERKAKQQEKRDDREKKLEKVKTTKPKTGIKMPKMAANIGNFFAWLAFGVILNSLWKLLPKLLSIVKILEPIAKFIAGAVAKTFEIIVGFIELAYAGYDKLEKLIEDIGGEGLKEKFHRFSDLLKVLIQGALAAAAAGVLAGNLAKAGVIGSLLTKLGLGGAVTTGVTAGGVTITTTGGAAAGSLLKAKLGLMLKSVIPSIVGLGKPIVGLGAKALGVAKALPLVAAGKVILIGTAISGVSMAVGEGNARIMKLIDKLTNYSREAHEKSKDLKWWDPRKYFWGVTAGVSDVIHRFSGALGGIFDTIGVPFRLLSNWVRVRFAKPEDKKATEEKIAEEMTQFGGRLREQYRRFVNMFDITQLFGGKGMISDEKGAWSAGDPKEGLKEIYQEKTIDRGVDSSIDMRLKEIPWLKRLKNFLGKREEVKEEKLDNNGTIKGNSTSLSQGLDIHPSYAQGGMMIVDNTITYIQPVEV